MLGVVFVGLANFYGVKIAQKVRDSLDYVLKKINEVGPSNSVENANAIDDLGYQLFLFGLVVIGFALLKGLFMFFMRQTIIVVSRLIEYDMRKEIFEHLETLDYGFYKEMRTGDLMARISEDVSKVRNYLGPAILYGINLITLFILTIYAMYSVNPTLATYTLIPLPFLSLSIYYVSTMINQRSTVIQQQIAKLTSIAQEVFSGIRVVKSYGKENNFNQYFTNESLVYKDQSLDLAKINAYFFPLMLLLINLSTLIVLYVGGKQVAAGTITTGNIAEFIIYVNMLTWPVTSIGWIASIIQEAEASQERINELLKTKSKLINGTHSPEKLKGKIEFKNVSFTYPDTGIEALKNINLVINEGEKVAIVGRTAAGKSTIAELLLRMYDTTNGQILIDNKVISDFEKNNLRKKIGYVPQDVFLFSDNVYNNIAFGIDEEIDNEKIELFAEYASVKEDILRLPNGFETLIGERGVTLSGGQKQRISIARALIKEPDIVILDDCLSAVDTETEQKILNYLRTALKGKTSIVITHRLTSLHDFDRIFMIENNTIIETGSHEELMMQNGQYAELYQMGGGD